MRQYVLTLPRLWLKWLQYVDSVRHIKVMQDWAIIQQTIVGAVANLRSHIWITGYLSSSEQVNNWVATSGCQAIQLHLTRFEASVTWIIGSFFLRSQTIERAELGWADANMCSTCLFQASATTSSSGYKWKECLYFVLKPVKIRYMKNWNQG